MRLHAERQPVTAYRKHRALLPTRGAQAVQRAGRRQLTILRHRNRLVQDHQARVMRVGKPGEVSEAEVVDLARGRALAAQGVAGTDVRIAGKGIFYAVEVRPGVLL